MRRLPPHSQFAINNAEQLADEWSLSGQSILGGIMNLARQRDIAVTVLSRYGITNYQKQTVHQRMLDAFMARAEKLIAGRIKPRPFKTGCGNPACKCECVGRLYIHYDHSEAESVDVT